MELVALGLHLARQAGEPGPRANGGVLEGRRDTGVASRHQGDTAFTDCSALWSWCLGESIFYLIHRLLELVFQPCVGKEVSESFQRLAHNSLTDFIFGGG